MKDTVFLLYPMEGTDSLLTRKSQGGQNNTITNEKKKIKELWWVFQIPSDYLNISIIILLTFWGPVRGRSTTALCMYNRKITIIDGQIREK